MSSLDLLTDSDVSRVRLVRGTDGSLLSGIRFLEANSVDLLTKFRFHVRGVCETGRESLVWDSFLEFIPCMFFSFSAWSWFLTKISWLR